MTYTDKFANGRFKFERSGFLGHGDSVYVYKDGEKIDEFELDDWVLESLKTGSDSDKKRTFRMACMDWYTQYGYDL
ncbi:MAG: hypothetical protein IJU71_07370 [Selenomonadaceae bacterium]|nr:hypothetical protein [Selenomonadaceae bacterium]